MLESNSSLHPHFADENTRRQPSSRGSPAPGLVDSRRVTWRRELLAMEFWRSCRIRGDDGTSK